MFWRATAIVTLAITCKALGDDVRTVPPCSAEAMRYVEKRREARIAGLEQLLGQQNANLRRGRDRDNQWRQDLIAKKKATEKEIAGLRDGSISFVPDLGTVSRLSQADVGRFSDDRFFVVRVISANEIEARQILPTMSITAIGLELHQSRGPDKIGPVARFAGIDATGLAPASEVTLRNTFEVVGRVPSSSGGECLKLQAVFIRYTPAPTKKGAPDKKKSKKPVARSPLLRKLPKPNGK